MTPWLGTALETRRRDARTAERERGAGPVDADALLGALVGAAPGLRALEVRGHAFRDALLDDGDVVLWQRDVEVQAGELAAVRLEGRAGILLRRVHFEGERVRLEPEDRHVPAAIVLRTDVCIQGRVIAIARREPIAT